jgi:hypothetical protein
VDSVRFRETNATDSMVIAKVEIFLSLMFGQTLALGDHQFLDSEGFLVVCHEFNRSYELLEEKDRTRMRNVFPFRLGLRSNWTTVDGFIADKLGDPGYKLSRWTGIGNHQNPDMTGVRKQIKNKILEGTFQFEDDPLVPDEDKDAAKELRIARRYFALGQQGQIETPFGNPVVINTDQTQILPNYLTLLADMEEKEIEIPVKINEELKRVGVEVDGFFTKQTLDASIQLITALKELKGEGISFENRSNVRLNPQARAAINNDEIYDGILELYDSFYNTSSATSGGAHSAVASVARNIENTFVKAAEDLATYAKQICSGRTSKPDFAPTEKSNFAFPLWSQDLRFDLLRGTQEEETLAQIPWDVVWTAFLDPNWQTSVQSLNKSLSDWDKLLKTPSKDARNTDNAIQALRGAISNHTGLVASLIKDPAWKIESKTDGSYSIDYVSKLAGKAANLLARTIYGGLTRDLASPTPEMMGETADFVVEVGTNKLQKLMHRRKIQGRYHKVLENLYREYP